LHPQFQPQPGNWCCCCCTRIADDVAVAAAAFTSILQAYDDADLPPTSAVSNASIALLGVDFWGKRTMTNDFATVVHRMKALGGQQHCRSQSSSFILAPFLQSSLMWCTASRR
jgi:hypothetical protein